MAVSLADLEQFQRTTGLVAVGGAAFATGAITLLIHLLARRLIFGPLGEIRRVTARARAGAWTTTSATASAQPARIVRSSTSITRGAGLPKRDFDGSERASEARIWWTATSK